MLGGVCRWCLVALVGGVALLPKPLLWLQMLVVDGVGCVDGVDGANGGDGAHGVGGVWGLVKLMVTPALLVFVFGVDCVVGVDHALRMAPRVHHGAHGTHGYCCTHGVHGAHGPQW